MPGKPAVMVLIPFLMLAATAVLKANQVPAQTQSQAAAKAGRYVCPMHGDVTSAKPGKCGKCGMALRLTDSRMPAGADQGQKNSGSFVILGSRIPDVKVYDQNGNQKNFYTDLVQGKTVAINFIFTTCTTICPPMTATLRRVQQYLAKGGRDVHLISVSVDPTTDTPERLRAYAAKFQVEAGWTFVTGEGAEIDALLKVLGAAVADKNDHTSMMLIGNDVTGYWTRANGLSSPSTLERLIDEAASRK